MSDVIPDEDELLSIPQAARALGVAADTVRGWVQKGAMKCKRIGPPSSKKKLVRITRRELQRHMTDEGER
jgi:excisionase family DNA binding protein